MIDRYNRLPYIYQSRIGYGTLIQNVILKQMINLMSTILVDIKIELKTKMSRLNNLEGRLL